MKKILMSVLVIAVVVGVVVGASGAYFSDEETSTGNTFTAGTIDLAVNSGNPWVSAAFAFTDVKPSQELDPFTIKFENVGNNEGILYTCFDYVENDKTVDDDSGFEFAAGTVGSINPAMEMTADQFASLVYVTAVEYQYTCSAEGYVGAWHDDLPKWLDMDINGDEKVSLYEMKQAGPISYDPSGDPFLATATVEWKITFHLGDTFDDDAGDPYTGGMDSYPGAADYDIVDDGITMWNVPQADGIDGKVSGILLQVGAPTPPTCP